jgi:hypothetical protein
VTTLRKFLSCILLLSASGWAQNSEQPVLALTRQHLVKSAKIYFRDSTEFPMTQNMTFTVTDSAGHVREVKHQATDYLFNGYNPSRKKAVGNLRAKESFWALLRGSKMIKAAINSTFWTMMPGVWIYADPAEYIFEAQNPHNGIVSAKLMPVKSCSPLTMEKNPQTYFPDEVCGPGVFELHDDLSFQKFVFDASGLPVAIKTASLGNTTLQSYHAEVEFQKVILPGDKEPFLVPKQVTARLETNKGNIVISSLYEARKSKQ